MLSVPRPLVPMLGHRPIVLAPHEEGLVQQMLSSKCCSLSYSCCERTRIALCSTVEGQEHIAIREKYVPAAYRGQLLYFCIASLANIEPTYQYSLTWYSNLFIDGCRRADKSNDIEQRVENINTCFT